jgi:hypothetical protein
LDVELPDRLPAGRSAVPPAGGLVADSSRAPPPVATEQAILRAFDRLERQEAQALEGLAGLASPAAGTPGAAGASS